MVFTETYLPTVQGVRIVRFLSRTVSALAMQLSGIPTGKLVGSSNEGHWEKRAKSHFTLSYYLSQQC